MNGSGRSRTRRITWVLAGWLLSCAPGPDGGAMEGSSPPPEGPLSTGAPSEGAATSAQDNCSGHVLATNNGVYSAGALLTLAWAAPAHRPAGDWVGLFKKGAPDSTHLSRQDVPPGAVGLLSFSAPSRGGTYELRYMTAGGSTPVASSNTFTVNAEPGHVLLLSNYDGGTYTLVMDENLPNVQIGIVSYRPSHVTVTGPYASNVSILRMVSYSSQASTVQGVDPSKVQVAPPQPATHHQPYASTTLGCATGARVLSWPGGGCNTMTQVEEYFLSQFGEVPFLSHLSRYEAFSGSISLSQARLNLVVARETTHLDVAQAVGRPSQPVAIRVDVNANLGALSPQAPALTTGALASGSTVRINNHANILGAGGSGGSGGNGGSGGRPRACNRDGMLGGTAIELTVPATLTNRGNIWGGGGGGAGGSGCNRNAGGGGGAGFVGGAGGEGASALSGSEELAYCGQDNGVRTGEPGRAGGTAGGQGGRTGDYRGDGSYDMLGGDGGGFGQPGEPAGACGGLGASAGGAAGAAIKRRGHAVNVPDGRYDTGGGRLRGPVMP